ncbi:unnamed protein product, partial [Rangifer tarandus platyrhynchus]
MVNNWPHSLSTDVWAPAPSSSSSRPRFFFPLTAEAAAGQEMTSSWSSCSREGLSGWEPKLSGLVSWKASLAQSSDYGSGLTGSARPFVPSPWHAHGHCVGSWCLQEELEPPWCDQQKFRKCEERERRCVLPGVSLLVCSCLQPTGRAPRRGSSGVVFK